MVLAASPLAQGGLEGRRHHLRNTYADRYCQISHHGQHKRDQQQCDIRFLVRHISSPFVRLTHVPCRQHQQSRQCGHRQITRQGRRKQNGHQDCERVNDTSDRRLSARPHIRRRARNRARRRQATEQCRSHVRCPLCHHFGIASVLPARHPVRHHSGQKGFHTRQEGNHKS